MAKRGRKPGKVRKGYWYEEQEEAFAMYLTAETKEEKEEIFNQLSEGIICIHQMSLSKKHLMIQCHSL